MRGDRRQEPALGLDPRVKAFLERPIEGDWPYLWIDATYLKVRRGGRILGSSPRTSVAAIIAVAVNTDGRREVLGMQIGTSEAEPIWTEFLRKLKGDANFRYDVWELTDGKWLADIVTMFDAHQPGWTSRLRDAHPAARKVLSLKQADMVAFDHPSLGPIIGTVVKFGVNGQITLVPHNEAGDLKRRDAAPQGEDAFKYYAPTAGGLRKIKLRQVRVDETGRVFDPGPQDRASRAARRADAID